LLRGSHLVYLAALFRLCSCRYFHFLLLKSKKGSNKAAYFTTTYFHRPEEFAAEASDDGFAAIQILAIEGPAWSAALLREAWNDGEQRQKLLEFLP